MRLALFAACLVCANALAAAPTRAEGPPADKSQYSTGRTQSPGLFEVLAWLGRDRVRARLARWLEYLGARVSP